MSGIADFIDYYGEADGFDLSKDPRCLFGWGPGSRLGCWHMFGHFCTRKLGHPGRCADDTATPRLECEYAQRPKDWDAHGRAEANR